MCHVLRTLLANPSYEQHIEQVEASQLTYIFIYLCSDVL